MWPLSESWLCGVPGVVWHVPVSPFSPGVCRNSWMPPLPVTSPFLSHWHKVGVIPGHQVARKPIDHWQISSWLTLLATSWVGGCDAEIVSIFGMSIKSFIFSEKIKNAIGSNCCISIPSFLGVCSNASLPHCYLFWLSVKLLARVINCMLTHSRRVGWLASFTMIESTKRTTLL